MDKESRLGGPRKEEGKAGTGGAKMFLNDITPSKKLQLKKTVDLCAVQTLDTNSLHICVHGNDAVILAQSVPRTPGGTPSMTGPHASSTRLERGAGGVEHWQGKQKEGRGQEEAAGGGGGGGSSSGVGGAGGGGIGGPTASMLQLALRRKFANTRQSLLPDRRCL
jgi:hypothetical protein